MKKSGYAQLAAEVLAMRLADAIVEWGRALDVPDAEAARRAERKRDAVVDELLRRGTDGQEAIAGLLDDVRPGVRVSAATYALHFAPERAEPLLESIAAGPPGIHRLNAECALELWRGQAQG